MAQMTITLDAPCGKVAGHRTALSHMFYGIPFGRAARLRPAERIAPWAGVREAHETGAIAPQNASSLDALTGSLPAEQSEDCLHLNIFTPGLDGPGRPVMVWIHGGAFTIGSGSFPIYDGRYLAALGAVVVTINYRLGALGFLRSHGASGSLGVSDQIMAFEWVRDNISAFGGDPGNVTIFGESAGAMSVACLLAAPSAKGLFHKAILQSGAGHIARAPDHAERTAASFLRHLDGDPHAAPADAILKAQAAVIDEVDNQHDPHHLGAMPFQPCADGTIVAQRPIDALRAGMARGVPILCGTTTEEWKLWTALDPKFHTMDEGKLERWATRQFGDHAPSLLQSEKFGTPYERYVAMQTDRAFREPALRLMAAQSAHTPVFDYVFDWRSPMFGGAFGACHALELAYVFGTHKTPKADAFFGAGPEADALAAAMTAAWAAFAKTGRPHAPGAEDWSAWTPSSPVAMVLGADSRPAHPARFDLEPAWHALPDTLVGP
jgi:para-nitrobenzyl esterase